MIKPVESIFEKRNYAMTLDTSLVIGRGRRPFPFFRMRLYKNADPVDKNNGVRQLPPDAARRKDASLNHASSGTTIRMDGNTFQLESVRTESNDVSFLTLGIV